MLENVLKMFRQSFLDDVTTGVRLIPSEMKLFIKKEYSSKYTIILLETCFNTETTEQN